MVHYANPPAIRRIGTGTRRKPSFVGGRVIAPGRTIAVGGRVRSHKISNIRTSMAGRTRKISPSHTARANKPRLPRHPVHRPVPHSAYNTSHPPPSSSGGIISSTSDLVNTVNEFIGHPENVQGAIDNLIDSTVSHIAQNPDLQHLIDKAGNILDHVPKGLLKLFT